MVTQGLDIDLDMCINIAEEADKISTTLTNTLSAILQIKISNLLNYVNNYVTIVISMMPIFFTLYTIVSDMESLLTSIWRQIVIISIILMILTAYFYFNAKFRHILKKLLGEAESLAKELKNIECRSVEMFEYYKELLSSCRSNLCNDIKIGDLKTSMLCKRLDKLQKIDLRSLLSCS